MLCAHDIVLVVMMVTIHTLHFNGISPRRHCPSAYQCKHWDNHDLSIVIISISQMKLGRPRLVSASTSSHMGSGRAGCHQALGPGCWFFLTGPWALLPLIRSTQWSPSPLGPGCFLSWAYWKDFYMIKAGMVILCGVVGVGLAIQNPHLLE